MGLADFYFFLEVVALVGVGFALSYAYFYLHAAVFPIHAQQRQGAAFHGGGHGELEDFLLVQQQAARALGRVIEPLTRSLPWLDITAVEENLVVLDAGVGIGNIDFPGADGFYLGALQLKPGLVFFKDVEIPPSFAVGGDFRAHGVFSKRNLGMLREPRVR